MDRDRPRVVLDCSNLLEWNAPAVLLLLRCLEEAMKRNGDVRLAGLSEKAKTVLELAGAHRLFQIFNSPAEAVESFHNLAADVVSPAFLSESDKRASENAA